MTESIGAKLRAAREAKRLTFEQVSQALRIRLHHLQALVSDDYSAIPSAAQARGFLRNYAGYLGLNVDEILPAARPPQPPPADSLPASAQSVKSALEAPQPSGTFFSSLRDRFTRRRAARAGTPASEEQVPIVESISEPKPMVVEESHARLKCSGF